MKKVLINVSFKDRYTGKTRVAGKTAEMSEERVAEIKEVNPNFITVIGNVEDAPVNGAETLGDEEPVTSGEEEPVTSGEEEPVTSGDKETAKKDKNKSK